MDMVQVAYEKEIQTRIEELRQIKAELSRMHGRKIPRSFSGGKGGSTGDKSDDESDEKACRARAKALGISTRDKYDRQLKWDEIIPRAHDALKSDLEPYFRRFHRQAKKAAENS